ncbi:L-lactate permease [Streptomyces celluloflavus]|uniref:L-lactate permease n=1 Tax=Streptomyces celluloflavus TaxID=58344 RepID=UPI0036A53590
MGNPIEALAKATSLPAGELGAMVGRQSAVIAFLVPFALLMILDGRRGLRQVWPAALVAGLGFGAGQFACSNFFVEQLTDLVAATTATGATALRCYGQAFRQIRWAVLTISCVLALSCVMYLSGMAVSLGTWLAGLGSVFALLSGFLGWFGVALTGSDTSSNALFGGMQIAAAHRIGISPLLMAATNSTGGVQGKAAAMQNLAIAAGAVGLPGKEGDILREVIGWSLALLAVFCVLAFLQSTVLTWTIPGG